MTIQRTTTMLLTLAWQGLAQAAAGADGADGDAALASVMVLGHYDNAVGSADAASQGTVTAALIANRPALRTGELLEFVPGMIVTQHSGDGKANQYFLRGFNLDHGTDFATWVDGVPVNMRSNAHGQGYSDLNFLMPELVQRIDYKKGSYFADEGDFSAAGAAQLRLADKLPGQASLTLGSYGYQRGVLADAFAAAGGTLLYGLELSRNNGPWEAPEQVRKYSATLRYSEGDGQAGYSITAMAYRNRWNATDQVPQRAVQSGLIGPFGSLDPSDGGDTSRTSLAWNLHRRDNDHVTEASAYLVHSSLDLYSNFTYLLNDPVNGDQFQQSERRTMGGASLSQAWLSQLSGIDLRNKLGVQTRYDHIAPIGLYATVARQRIGTVREDRINQASVGLYAENTAYWTPWLRSIAGLRYDSYRFQVNDDSVSAGKFSPKLSLILGPWRRTEYFLNYGAGFHSNDARGVTAAEDRAPPLVGTRGAELGVRSEWLPGLQSSLALWTLDIDSELVYAGDSGQTEASRASRRRGIEWSNHYIAAPWLLFDLDLSASHARYRQDDPAGNYVPEALDRVASFGVTVKDRGRWFGGFELRYFGPRPLTEDNRVRSAATTLAYGRIGYQLDSKTRLTLDGFNLFNRRASDIDYYYPSRLAGEPAEGVSDVHSHPVEPRTLRLTLSRKF